ncbi:lipid A deacylase LpxR family protein [Fibrella sp. WM1]|uniref:lipid A deacylase LpxR family protein n=1 Tax=Fibrella musci TaxID=3242485 RepID=UPI003521D27D
MRFFLLILLVCRFSTTFSQDSSSIAPVHLARPVGAFVQLDWENDAFQVHQRSVSDRYYSNGIRVTHLSNYWQKWPTRLALLRLAAKENRVYTPLYTFTAGQDIYTPRDTKTVRRPLYPNDRPYAGYLYLSWGLTTTDPTGGRRLSSALTLGVIGPLSGAAELQEGIHTLLKQPVPVGWGAQIKNDPMVSYSVRYEGRSIPRFSSVFDVITDVEGTIGTLTNAAGMGGTLRIGLANDYFQHPTGMHDAGYVSSRRFQCYAFVRVGFRAVLDNALMQGGWLNGSKNYYALPAVELQHFLGQLDVGGVIGSKNVQLAFIQHLRTAEFVGALVDQWGHLSLLIRVGQ